MKKIQACISECKTGFCYIFTGFSIFYILICLNAGIENIPVLDILLLMAASAVNAFIQWIAFSDRIIKNVKYTWRLLIFFVSATAGLAILAVLFDWFPVEQPVAWLKFIGISFASFAVISLGFEIYFRATGKKYAGLLGQYKKKREKENGDK